MGRRVERNPLRFISPETRSNESMGIPYINGISAGLPAEAVSYDASGLQSPVVEGGLQAAVNKITIKKTILSILFAIIR